MAKSTARILEQQYSLPTRFYKTLSIGVLPYIYLGYREFMHSSQALDLGTDKRLGHAATRMLPFIAIILASRTQVLVPATDTSSIKVFGRTASPAGSTSHYFDYSSVQLYFSGVGPLAVVLHESQPGGNK
jgi:hypothetical protein